MIEDNLFIASNIEPKAKIKNYIKIF